jgi:hypothetical protein
MENNEGMLMDAIRTKDIGKTGREIIQQGRGSGDGMDRRNILLEPIRVQAGGRSRSIIQEHFVHFAW